MTWSAADPTTFSIIVGIIVFCLFFAIALMLFLFCSRIYKSWRINTAFQVREHCRGIVNALVVNDTLSDSKSLPAYQYHLEQIRLMTRGSAFRNDVLINLLLDIKKNLSGSSAQAILGIYDALALERYSVKKLRSFSWQKRAQAIRELGEMKRTGCILDIFRFIHSRNATLRQESFMALVRLQETNPFSFLDRYRETITPWMQLTIHAFLRHEDVRRLPDFSRWFKNANPSVRLFTIQMAKQFRQREALPKIVGLISDSDPIIATAALEAIIEMEAFEHADAVIRELHMSHGAKLIACIRAAGKIGEPAQTAVELERYLAHPDYTIRFAAAESMYKLGSVGRERLEKYNTIHANQLQSTIGHLYEPLLN